MDFARDTVTLSEIASAVSWMEAGTASSNVLLVDPALIDQQRLRAVLTARSLVTNNVLELSPLAAFGDMAPRTAFLDSSYELQALIASLTAIDPTSPYLTFIKTKTTHDELHRVLASLALVQVDDLSLHCRFADARVLDSLLRHLDLQQRRAIAFAVQAWGWFDSAGRFVVHDFESDEATGIQTAGIDPCLVLTSQQFDVLLRESEVDTMFSMLLETTPELVPPSARGRFRARLQQYLKTADDLNVASARDRAQFIVLSLTCGEDFHRLPGLAGTWQKVRDHGSSLLSLIESWGDELWREVEGNTEVAS